jgi:hypothetical protein
MKKVWPVDSIRTPGRDANRSKKNWQISSSKYFVPSKRR